MNEAAGYSRIAVSSYRYKILFVILSLGLFTNRVLASDLPDGLPPQPSILSANVLLLQPEPVALAPIQDQWRDYKRQYAVVWCALYSIYLVLR